MSSGYLMISEVSLDGIKKNRYMKFEGLKNKYNFHAYVRMEYLNQNQKLMELDAGGFFHLSEYGVSFFNDLKCVEIYFSYFLLEKCVSLEGLVKRSYDLIKLDKKIPLLSLGDKGKFSVELNELYRLKF